jgi:hypothetical protein
MQKYYFEHAQTLSMVLYLGAQADALAALVALEECGLPEALIGAVSAGKEGQAYVMLVCLFVFDIKIIF